MTNEQVKRFWDKVDIKGIDECWEWRGGKFSNGYGQIEFDYKKYKAHRIAFALAFDYFPVLILHTCDNRLCCNPNHLKDKTHTENMRDLRNKGRRIKKLSLEQIAVIRTMEGTQKQIAEQFGIHPSLVSQIKSGKIYKGVIS